MPNAPEGYLVFRTESLYNLQHVKWRYIPASGGSTAARPSTPTAVCPGRTAPTQRRTLPSATAAGVTV